LHFLESTEPTCGVFQEAANEEHCQEMKHINEKVSDLVNLNAERLQENDRLRSEIDRIKQQNEVKSF